MILTIVSIAAPLLLITMGALISEYAGRLAMFLEHIINLGAFFCYACTYATGSLASGMMLSVLLCTLLVFSMETLASRCNANMFLISLAMNLLFAAFTTFFSALLFKTRGVLASDAVQFSAPTMRLVTSIACYAVVGILLFMLRFTGTGLILRVTGSDADVLESEGVAVARYRSLAWIIAAGCGALAGCVYTARLSAFVPGGAAWRGWTALAAVYLGRKHPLLVVLAVAAFAIAEYASTAIQNIALFAALPSSVLLALPYLLALALIVLVPRR